MRFVHLFAMSAVTVLLSSAAQASPLVSVEAPASLTTGLIVQTGQAKKDEEKAKKLRKKEKKELKRQEKKEQTETNKPPAQPQQAPAQTQQATQYCCVIGSSTYKYCAATESEAHLRAQGTQIGQLQPKPISCAPEK